MKRKVRPGKARARSLKEMAKISLERLNSFDKLKYPSNTLDDYYDILHQLMEASSLLNGIKFSGDFAHKELISWASKERGLNFQEHAFLQSIRTLRNRISYEGLFVPKSFISQNDKKINNLIRRFLEKLEEELK